MDLPIIGAHCALERCGELDLLPIECPGCHSLFCRHHIALSCHSCSSLTKDRVNSELSEDTSTKSKRERCAQNSCQNSTFDSVVVQTVEPGRRMVATCPHCSGAFCAVWVAILVFLPFKWTLTFCFILFSQVIVILLITLAKIFHHHLLLRRIPRLMNSSRNTFPQPLQGHLCLTILQSLRPTPRKSPGFVGWNS